MKKARLFLLAALLIGVGSAFTTVKTTHFATVYITLDGGVTWLEEDSANEGNTFRCVSGSSYCEYSQPDLAYPIGTNDMQKAELIP